MMNGSSGRGTALKLTLRIPSYMTLVMISLQACTTNVSNSVNGSAEGLDAQSSTGSGSSISDSIPSRRSSANFITIGKIVATPSNPQGSLDVVGDTSGVAAGAFGKYCVPSSDSGASAPSSDSAYGPSTCKCVFDYTLTTSSGQTQARVETDTIYHEINLLRCSLDEIPSTVGALTVRIRHIPTDYLSPGKGYDFASGSSNADYKNLINYAKVSRHQCRPILSIHNILDITVYDPFQSDDPTLAFPLNYYATNRARYLTNYIDNNVPLDGAMNIEQSSICPIGELTPGSAPYDSKNLLDYSVYSLGAMEDLDKTGVKSKQIFPSPPGFFDRSSFLLAKNPLGRFSVPINAWVFPNVITQTPPPPSKDSTTQSAQTAPLPIGYAVAPSRSGGKETCPSSSDVKVPAGYQWVKLWLFRASLRPRVFKTSHNLNKYLDGEGQKGFVSCEPFPKSWPQAGLDGTTGTPRVVADCEVLGADETVRTSHSEDLNKMLNRVLWIGGQPLACVGMKQNSSTPNCTGATGAGCTTQAVSTNSEAFTLKDAYLFSDQNRTPKYALGTDIWHPKYFDRERTGICGGQSSSSSGVLKSDPFGVCGVSGSSLQDSGIAQDNDVVNSNVIDRRLDNDISRSDYLFVVTPTDINTSDMVDVNTFDPKGISQLSPKALQYIPRRFYHPGGCNHSKEDSTKDFIGTNPDISERPDPLNPGHNLKDPTCKDSEQIIYGPKLYDILSDLNPDGAGQSVKDKKFKVVYPVCTLQRIDPTGESP